MLTAEAVICTEHPDRYLARLGEHTTKMGSGLRHRPRAHGSGHASPGIQNAEWSGARGTVTLNWGRWTAEAAPGMLTLRAEAADAENLRKIKDMLTTRLEGFGRREHLCVTWHSCGTPAAGPGHAG